MGAISSCSPIASSYLHTVHTYIYYNTIPYIHWFLPYSSTKQLQPSSYSNPCRPVQYRLYFARKTNNKHKRSIINNENKRNTHQPTNVSHACEGKQQRTIQIFKSHKEKQARDSPITWLIDWLRERERERETTNNSNFKSHKKKASTQSSIIWLIDWEKERERYR